MPKSRNHNVLGPLLLPKNTLSLETVQERGPRNLVPSNLGNNTEFDISDPGPGNGPRSLHTRAQYIGWVCVEAGLAASAIRELQLCVFREAGLAASFNMQLKAYASQVG